MSSESLFGYFVIILTLFFAFVFSIVALPDFFPAVFGYLRPDWVLLFLIYWILALPNRIGMTSAFVAGILTDVLMGNLMGVNALTYTLIAYLLMLQYQRLRMFSILQQMLVVFLLVFISQILQLWVVSVVSGTDFSLLYFMPTIATALIWPFAFLSLRFIRRTVSIS